MNGNLTCHRGWHGGGPAVRTQVFGEVISDTFGSHENENFGVFLGDCLEVTQETGSLVVLGANLNNLCDVVIGGQLQGTNVDLDKVVL